MSRLRAGPLAAWTSTWLAAGGPADEVIGAVTSTDAPHQVVGLDDAAVPLSEVLIRWRRAGEPVRLVLPVPGDVRGVPGPPEFRDAAIDAGEAVHGAGIGLVPSVVDHAPSSAPSTVIWQAFDVLAAPPDYLAVADAQHDLTEAIRDCAAELSAADVAGADATVLAGLATARGAGERINLPPGYPPRAIALVSQAERLRALLELAGSDPIGGAIDQRGVTARAAGLRPLETAVRRACLAGYNAAADC